MGPKRVLRHLAEAPQKGNGGATAEQLKRSEAVTLKGQRSGPQEVPQAARASATERRWGHPDSTTDAKLGSGRGHFELSK